MGKQVLQFTNSLTEGGCFSYILYNFIISPGNTYYYLHFRDEKFEIHQPCFILF